jgi:hypothetical protein
LKKPGAKNPGSASYAEPGFRIAFAMPCNWLNCRVTAAAYHFNLSRSLRGEVAALLRGG